MSLLRPLWGLGGRWFEAATAGTFYIYITIVEAYERVRLHTIWTSERCFDYILFSWRNKAGNHAQCKCG
jgi:hypothetical protein